MHPKWLQILDEGGPAQPNTIQDVTLLSQNATTMPYLGNLEPQLVPRSLEIPLSVLSFVL